MKCPVLNLLRSRAHSVISAQCSVRYVLALTSFSVQQVKLYPLSLLAVFCDSENKHSRLILSNTNSN